ncbi:serine threonine- kinase N2 isoform X1 [Pelobates cultripes]|uniref:Serine threonine- kinase N2 isoform X1 n=1 Tax=Pelobates cultripes TaxID=61616 RepID=A0AAD1R9I3_PELCU|nr:serine threonine- kinase N2 isoform X1 [Pelobates cultripes]
MANRNVFSWIRRLPFRKGARRKKCDDTEQKGEDPSECPIIPNSPKIAKGSAVNGSFSSIDLNSPKRIVLAANSGSSKDIPKHVAQPDIDKVREQIKQEIRKELKITAGARNMVKATTKKKHLAKVNKFLKTSQKKLDDLYIKLQERNAHIVVPDAEEISAAPKDDTSSQADNAKLTALQKQLSIELKVKQGAEIMVGAYSNGHSKNVKHLTAVQKILQDSENKIDSLRNLILEETSIIKEETSLPVPETDINILAPSLLVTDVQEPEPAGDIPNFDMKPINPPDVEFDSEPPPAPSQSFLHSDQSWFSFHIEIPDILAQNSGDIYECSIDNRYIITPDEMSHPNCSSLDNSLPEHSENLSHDHLPAMWTQDQLLLKLQDIQQHSVQSGKDSGDSYESSSDNRFIVTPDEMSHPNCSSLDKSVPEHSEELPHDHLPAMLIQDQLLLKLQDIQQRSVQSVKNSGDIYECSIDNRYIITPDEMSYPNCSSLDNSVPEHSENLPHDHLPAMWTQDQLLLKLQDIQQHSVQSGKDSGDSYESSSDNRFIVTPDEMSQPNCSSLDNSVPEHSEDLPHDHLPAMLIQDQLLLKLQDIQQHSVQSVKNSGDIYDCSIDNRYIMTPDEMSHPNCSSLNNSVPENFEDLPHGHLPAMWIQDQLLRMQDFQYRSVQSVKDSGGSYGCSIDNRFIMTPDEISEPNCSSLDNSVSENSEDLSHDYLPAVCTQGRPTLRMQDFQLCSVLGKGQFGKVLLAEHKETTNMYALKFIKKVNLESPHQFNNLLSEKRIFQTVSNRRHPFLMNLFGCFHTRDHACFVMEYAAGGDLLTCLDNNHGPFPEPRAVFYSACVVLGLEYLHEQNIVHRDLKLENIVLDERGFAKITDYGLSKEANHSASPDAYHSPAVRLMMYFTTAFSYRSHIIYTCTHMLPFEGRDVETLYAKIAKCKLKIPESLSSEATSILSKLLTKKHEKRLGSSEKDAEEVKDHPYFQHIDWNAFLLQNVTPPFVPTINGAEDVSNFDAIFTSEAPIITPPARRRVPPLMEKKTFEDFCWRADWS